MNADEVKYCLGSDFENRHGLHPVAPRNYDGYRYRDDADGSGLVAGEARNSNSGGLSCSLQFASCGGFGLPMGVAHRCPGCGANMRTFCGDDEGEEEYGQMIWYPKCR